MRLFRVSRGFFNAKGVKIRVVGDLSFVGHRLRNAARLAEEKTRHNCRLTLRICVAYGSRNEVTRCLQYSPTCCCSLHHERLGFCLCDGVREGRRHEASRFTASVHVDPASEQKCVLKFRQRVETGGTNLTKLTCHRTRIDTSMQFSAADVPHQSACRADDSATAIQVNVPLCQQFCRVLLKGEDLLGNFLKYVPISLMPGVQCFGCRCIWVLPLQTYVATSCCRVNCTNERK